MKQIIYFWLLALVSCLLACIPISVKAQAFTGTYLFSNVTICTSPTVCTTDPTPVPTATGLTFGSFTAVGTPISPNAAARFSFTDWATGATNASNTFTGTINTSEYYEVTLTPNAGCSITLTGLTFVIQRSSTGIRQYSVRGSVDSYAANLPASINPANANLSVVATNIFQITDAVTSAQTGSTITLGASYANLTGPVTFRFYGFNAEASSGTFSIDDVVFSGSANCAATCAISDLSVTAGACNDNATPADITDDYYTATVTATYANPPASGTLNLSGTDLHATNTVTSASSPFNATSTVFSNVRIKANGAATSLTAAFSADAACTFTNSAIAAVNNCSSPTCGITLQAATIACGASTAATTDPVTVTIPYTGSNATAVLTNTGSGTPAATLTAPGNIVITGITEGQSYGFTITGGGCNITQAATLIPSTQCPAAAPACNANPGTFPQN